MASSTTQTTGTQTTGTQTTGGAPGPLGGLTDGPFGSIIMFLPIIALFYFLILRPQQKRAKEHAALVAGVKRGDTVVMSSGIIGKVTRVDDAEVQVEIAPTVNVKVVKSMITDVRTRGAPAVANDVKS